MEEADSGGTVVGACGYFARASERGVCGVRMRSCSGGGTRWLEAPERANRTGKWSGSWLVAFSRGALHVLRMSSLGGKMYIALALYDSLT